MRFKGVQQPKPVADFVRGRLAQVIRGFGATRHGRGLDEAAVKGRPIGIRQKVWERADSEAIVLEAVEEVQVEGTRVASVELLLHSQLVAVGGPVLVHSPGGVAEGEGDARRAIVVIQDLDLLLYYAVLHIESAEDVRCLSACC